MVIMEIGRVGKEEDASSDHLIQLNTEYAKSKTLVKMDVELHDPSSSPQHGSKCSYIFRGCG